MLNMIQEAQVIAQSPIIQLSNNGHTKDQQISSLSKPQNENQTVSEIQAPVQILNNTPKNEQIELECMEPMSIPFNPNDAVVKCDGACIQNNPGATETEIVKKERKLSASSAFIQVGSSPHLSPASQPYSIH